MALSFVSQPPMATQQDEDMMDIDLDVDVDVDPIAVEEILEEGEEPSIAFQSTSVPDTASIIPAIYSEDPLQEPQPEKVHIRGVDDMHTSDIRAFATEHFASSEPAHIQWIDDSSANIIYQSRDLALQALLSFTATPTSAEEIQNAPFEVRTAKALSSRPASMLQVRFAMAGDRKKKNARDASRYYLLNPDQDPTERMRKEFEAHGGRSRRGDHGDYQRRRFDDRELRRRRDKDQDADGGGDFAASMYDDAPAADSGTGAGARGRDLFSRVTRTRRRSASPGAAYSNSDEIEIEDSEDDSRPQRNRRNGYRNRQDDLPPYTRRDPNSHMKTNVGKELFSGKDRKAVSADRREGTLHSDRLELFPDKNSNMALLNTSSQHNGTGTTSSLPPTRTQSSADFGSVSNAAAAKRLKADLLASVQTSPRGHSHRRSHAIDAKIEEDLSERFARKSLSMDSTKNTNLGKELFGDSSDRTGTLNSSYNNNHGGGSAAGLNIKGSATSYQQQQERDHVQGFNIRGTAGLSIKGRASAAVDTRELFPDQYKKTSGKGNEGKELFDQPVRPGRVRARADDWN